MKTLLLVSLIILGSCQGPINIKNISTITIGKSDLRENGTLSELISDIKFIPIETNDSSLLMGIDKVVYHDNCFYILDESTNKIIRCDQNGKFLGTIGKPGRGPGEFFEIRDFTIDKNNGDILVADYHKLHRYTKEGKYLNSFKTDFTGSFLIADSNGIIFYGYGINDNKLIFTDFNGTVKAKFISTSHKYYLVCGKHFHNYNNKVLYHLPPIDTIFQITDYDYEPHYFIDFGKNAFTNEDYNELSVNHKEHLSTYLDNFGDYLTIETFLETDSNIYLQIRNKNNLYSGIYNKLSMRSTLINHRKTKNDIFESQFYFNTKGITGNSYIMYIPAYNLLQSSNKKFIEKHLVNPDCLQEIKSYSNPVLMIVKPK